MLRRTVGGIAAAAAVGIALAWTAALVGGAGKEPPGRILIVADEQPQMEVLAAFLKTQGGYDVRIVDPKDLPPDLSGNEAVFMYIHKAMQDAVTKALIAYTEKGGRLVLLHHAIASSRLQSPEFLQFVGIRISPRDDPETPWRVVSNVTCTLVNLRPGHYITSHDVKYDRTVEYKSPVAPGLAGKFPALDLPDTEVFLNQQFTDGGAKTVLFGFRLEDPAKGGAIMQDRAGWLKPAGKGWIFYLQPGHAAADFKNRNYCQIIWNCLTWKPEAKPAAEEAPPSHRPAPPDNSGSER